MLRLHIKTENPQPRYINEATNILKKGGLLIYPTDTTYGLGCDIYCKQSIDRIYQIKGLDKKQRLSFICKDLSEVSRYAIINDKNYRILRHHIPGEYTFILPASRDVPKILQTKTRTVGIRIPKNNTCKALIQALGHPIISTTVGIHTLNGSVHINDPENIMNKFGKSVDVFLDADFLYGKPSSVIDLSGDEPVIIRKGSGDLSWLGGE